MHNPILLKTPTCVRSDSAEDTGFSLPLIDFKIGEKHFIGLIDSGASVNLISFQTLKGFLEDGLVEDLADCFMKITCITGNDTIIINF